MALKLVLRVELQLMHLRKEKKTRKAATMEKENSLIQQETVRKSTPQSDSLSVL